MKPTLFLDWINVIEIDFYILAQVDFFGLIKDSFYISI